jgi:hypothetical protein
MPQVSLRKQAETQGPMTALKKYQRLECPGLWRETPQDQRREVGVRFGDATLILIDPKSGTALSHWSLPAVERLNPGEDPPLFAPGRDALESLELTDPDMVEALQTVRQAVKAAIPRPGRLRGVLLGGTLVAVLGIAALWLPGALVAHTASVVPLALRAEIGQRALDDLARVTGAPCNNQLGLQALARLADRVFGPVDTPILYVMPEGVDRPLHLPGDVIVLPRQLIEQSEGPEVVAGAALVERLRSRRNDPIIPILHHAGLRATFHLLTTTKLPDAALQGYGEVRLRAPDAALDEAALVAAFEAAQLPATPYALSIQPPTAQSQALSAADPYKGLAPTELVPDEDWVALQGICGN